MKRSRSGDFAGFKTVTVWLPFGYQDFLVTFLVTLLLGAGYTLDFSLM
jgi:hypothetical protein